MAWFKGALYVGTARSAMCVENATIAYYLPDAGSTAASRCPGVTCPPTIPEADLRAEIWRYEPGMGRWTRVYRSPRDPEPAGARTARGTRHRLPRHARAHRARRAQGALCRRAQPGRVHPGAQAPRPPRILRTTDGEHFRALRARPPVIHTYLGPYRPVGFRALATVGRSLYVTASAGLTGDGVVLRVRRPGGRSPSFEQVSPPKLAVFELATFGGRLYAGTGDRESGYGVWRAAPAPATPLGAGRSRRRRARLDDHVGRVDGALSRTALCRRQRLAQFGVPSVGADPRRARRALGGRRGQRAARRGRRPALALERAARRLRQRLQPPLLAHAGVPGRAAARHERLELVAGRAPGISDGCARSSASTSTGRATARTGGPRRATASAAATTSASGPWPCRRRGFSSAPRTTSAGPRSFARGRGRARERPHGGGHGSPGVRAAASSA